MALLKFIFDIEYAFITDGSFTFPVRGIDYRWERKA